LRFLVRIIPANVSRDGLVGSVKSLARSLGADCRNPKWTSYGALELDVFCPTRADFDLFRAAVSPLAEFEFAKDLNQAPPHKPETELFAEARAYFNSERYWECHEVLEGIWKLKTGDEKRLLQGIILVCAAFVHHQKNEDGVALGVLQRAARQLDYPEPSYGGFQTARLRENVSGILSRKAFSNFRV